MWWDALAWGGDQPGSLSVSQMLIKEEVNGTSFSSKFDVDSDIHCPSFSSKIDIDKCQTASFFLIAMFTHVFELAQSFKGWV